MSQKEKVFADGFSFKRKENAPEFVVGRQSIKVDAAIAFLQTHQKNGWVNLDIKIAKGGNYYCELDTWEAPAKTEEAAPQATATTAGDYISPFFYLLIGADFDSPILLLLLLIYLFIFTKNSKKK
jgi:hypothetical protein